MSTSGDRVAVPSNGHRLALSDDPQDLPSEAEPYARRAAPAVSSIGPGQVIAGFGILAALILLVIGRRRGRRG